MASQKRIAKELAECTRDPPDGMLVKLVDESSIYKWEVLIDGPEQSPYINGHFKLHITFPTEYPFKPPVLSFGTKIYHPNVSNDDKGSMCLGMLRSDEWKPPNKVAAVLNMVRSLLVEPNVDDAIEMGIAEQWRGDRAAFDRTARDWVRRFASG